MAAFGSVVGDCVAARAKISGSTAELDGSDK